MADAAPDIIYSVDRAGDPVAIIERRIEGGRDAVLERYPGLTDGQLSTELARLVNHFAREFQYDVIDDPQAFAAAYRQQIATEDADATWQQGTSRLRDYGMPDLDGIEAPKLEGGVLVYFAKSRQLGVPYRVEVKINGSEIGEPSYEPMQMGPIE